MALVAKDGGAAPRHVEEAAAPDGPIEGEARINSPRSVQAQT